MEFEKRSHKVAFWTGWVVIVPITLLPLNWMFSVIILWAGAGLLVLRPIQITDFQDPFEAIPRYSIWVWCGFLACWPLIFQLRKTDDSKALKFVKMFGDKRMEQQERVAVQETLKKAVAQDLEV